VVSDDVRIELGEPTTGSYILAVGLYYAQSGERLPAVSQAQATISANRVMIPYEVPSP
jgi:hypothetical protein